MKEHGMLFKPAMVRARQAGRKTQTRRVVTRRNSSIDGGPSSKAVWDRLVFSEAWVDEGPSPAGNVGQYLHVPLRPHPDDPQDNRDLWTECRIYPRIRPGDRIYVKETFQPLLADGVEFADADYKTGEGYALRYTATDGRAEWHDHNTEEITDRCVSPIFMPRWGARIVCDVPRVRAQRVREITWRDVLSEGVMPCGENYAATAGGQEQLIEDFGDLWDSINLKRGFGWESDPWVWVYDLGPDARAGADDLGSYTEIDSGTR